MQGLKIDVNAIVLRTLIFCPFWNCMWIQGIEITQGVFIVEVPKIVAIMLIRNEDIHIERVIRNIVDFCDTIIITDHQSTDGTFETLKNHESLSA